MSVCVISQPRFFPGLHYLHRMLTSDIFVIFDTVQYTPRHEENRAKLKTPQGTQWLTVPINKKGRGQLILDTTINSEHPWQSKSIKMIETLYAKAPFYAEYKDEITAIINGPYTTLAELNYASWQPALSRLAPHCKFVYASELPVTGKGSQLLLDICTHLEVDTYLSGAFGKEYLDLDSFKAAKIEVDFHHYTYPSYAQRFGEFEPYLSYLDMLFNVGLDRETILNPERERTIA